MGELVCEHLHHASRFTTHLTIYTADFGTTEGRGCGRGEAEDRPRAGIIEVRASFQQPQIVSLLGASRNKAILKVSGGRARKKPNAGQRGSTTVTFAIGTAGALRFVRVSQSSGPQSTTRRDSVRPLPLRGTTGSGLWWIGLCLGERHHKTDPAMGRPYSESGARLPHMWQQ